MLARHARLRAVVPHAHGARRRRVATRPKRLIAIFQRGAVDGLSVVVPFGESEYFRARPSIAIPRPNAGENGAIDLDGFFGFNPRLQPLKRFWDARQLAIVHACGSPDSTRSHFDAQDYMETATPGVKSTSDGWLNRYLQARRDEAATPFRAVSLTQQLPRMLQGSAAGARGQPDRTVRHSPRPWQRHGGRVVRGGVRGSRR